MKTRIHNVFLSTFTACLFLTAGCDANNAGGNISANAADNTTGESSVTNKTLIAEITVRSHYSSNQCGIDKTSVILISNKTELETIITKSRRTALSDRPAALPDINFKENMALLIALGTRSSAGYNIKLTRDSAGIRDNILTLPVDIISPEKGGFQAQVITSPCIIISFTKGRYTQIIVNEVLDDIRL